MHTAQPFDFQCDVLEESHDIPVLVDFWAEWCAPCRLLGPVLERLALKYSGRWKLVKINTEEQQELALRYQVKSIPDVKLFVNGEVVDGFSGALPEYQIEEWLKKVLPGRYEKEILLAIEFVRQGKSAMASTLLEGVLHQEPENLRVRSLLVRLRLFLDPEEALLLSTPLEGEPEYAEQAETTRTLGRLIRLDRDKLADDPLREEYLAAAASLKQENFDKALEGFIGVLRRNRAYDDDGSRKACIAIFRFLGEEHDITRKHRRAFDRAF